nr:hydratase [Maliibacterium massiliense]
MKLHKNGVYLVEGKLCDAAPVAKEEARKGTIAYGILQAHNTAADMQHLRLKFDSMTSHDITYVGIILTACASGMERFPLPYVMTNCHNSLCAVGGTINEDDHQFALSAAHKFGGIYVPPNMAVIHSYNREMMSGCGRMILGSDSHTRYGALGTMGVGEGGGELAKQLVGRTYDMALPEVVAVHLTGKPRPGVGPQDVALAIVGATYQSGYVKNKVMEFIGPGVANLSADYRNGIDVMTTETTCWSSIWQTDEVTARYFAERGRPEAYKALAPASVAYYDGCIEIDLSQIECMIALPMHPSYALPIRQLQANPRDILREAQQRANAQLGGKVQMDLVSKVGADGKIHVDQGIVAGCSGGTYENICAVAALLRGKSCGAGEFSFSVYPDSMPTYLALVNSGAVADIVSAGGIFRECFCGPCFGAGDTPANGDLSIRHTTRNFPNREGSKPGEGQISGVALMDARSIAASAAAGGVLTAATDVMDADIEIPAYHFDQGVYDKRVYNGWGRPEPEHPLRFGPNIKNWPDMPALSEDLLLRVVSYITDPVTTTDELIPSGETSSFRSNPLRLAEFTLSRKDPAYVGRAKAVQAQEQARLAGALPQEVQDVYAALAKSGLPVDAAQTNIGSAIFANKPGDGSAREQAASCQRVLGGAANFACEYATKRYRSNCINWGMLPFLVEDASVLALGDYVFVPGVRQALLDEAPEIAAYAVKPDGTVNAFAVVLGALTRDERQILADGCLINYYREH